MIESAPPPDTGVEAQPISPADFARLKALIESELGIQTPASKKPLVEARIYSGLRGTGLSPTAYLQRAFNSADPAERRRLLELFTTHETRFFREEHHFRILEEHARKSTTGYRVWCTAASSGEEPWSIAMTLAELHHRSRPKPMIRATDVSRRILEKARNAVYGQAAIQGIPDKLRRSYLLQSKTPPPRFKIVPELREWVHYQRLNLMQGSYEVPQDFDAIFCRNVLIYFSREHQRSVVQRLVRHLVPGGLLILGHAESASEYDLPLESVGPTTYRKTT